MPLNITITKRNSSRALFTGHHPYDSRLQSKYVKGNKWDIFLGRIKSSFRVLNLEYRIGVYKSSSKLFDHQKVYFFPDSTDSTFAL